MGPLVVVPVPHAPHVSTPSQLEMPALRSRVVETLWLAAVSALAGERCAPVSWQLLHEFANPPLSSQPSTPLLFVRHEFKLSIVDVRDCEVPVAQFAASTCPAWSWAMPHVAV